MLKRIAKAIMLVVVALTPIVVIPQFYDPLALRYSDDVYQMVSKYECANAACTRLRLPEGTIHFKHGWTATTLADGSRLVPNNAPDCQVHIALIGDSFTWGPNVSDGDTWANRLAQQFPAACFYNYGGWGYNAEQAALTLTEQVPASMDYVIYFVFQNDDMGMYTQHDPGSPPSPLNLIRYAQLIAWKMGWWSGNTGWVHDKPRDAERFAAAIRQIGSDPRVRFVGFDSELLVHTVRQIGYDVWGISLPDERERISPIDDHPNPAGHRHIARDLTPLIAKLLDAEPAGGSSGG
jgi:hypothetical protein